MPLELKDLHEEMQGVWHEMRAALEEQQAEIKAAGEATGETKGKLEALNTRLDQIEVKMSRPQTQAAGGSEQKAAERKAFIEGLRKGLVNLRHEDAELAKHLKMAGPGEAKALSMGDDTAGGFLAPSDFVADIIKAVQLVSPIRSLATVRTTSNRSVLYPVRKGTFAATWVSETGSRSETAGLKYGLEEIPAEEVYAEVLISNADIEDSAFDMDAQIQMEATEQFAVAEGTAFVSGSGVGKPEGFTTNTEVLASYVPGTDASAVVYAGLADLFYGLKEAYAQNGTWVMNRQTMGKVRKIVDSNGDPIWAPPLAGFAGVQPQTILGRPVVEAHDMPNVASNAFPIAFGDFKRGYLVVDRITMVVQRLVEKYAETGQVAYLVRKRVGGQVVLAEAIRLLKIATS